MIWHWFTTAWRSLLGNPLFSLITIISLSVGCCGALLAGANIKQHLSFEHVHKDADRIYIVTRQAEGNLGLPSTMRIESATQNRPTTAVAMPLKAALAALPEIEAQTRMVYSSTLFQSDQDDRDRDRANGAPLPGDPPPKPAPGTLFVDEDFFKVFPLEFVEGSAEGLQEPDAIIITEIRAKDLFGNEPAVGKEVKGIKGHTLRIVGVLKTLPPTTHMAFQTLGGMRTMQMLGTGVGAAYQTNWQRSWSGWHYIKAKAGTSPETFVPAVKTAITTAAAAGMQQRAGGQQGMFSAVPQTYKWSLVPLLESHLAGPDKLGFTSTNGYMANAASGDMKMVEALAAGAIVLIIVSSFNYVTLSLARSLRRRREVAVRKVLGASRSALVRQYLVNSGMVTFISVLIGFAAAWYLFPWFARAIGQPETMFNLIDPVFLGIAAAVFVVLALIVGAYPAFYLAAVRPQTGLGEGGTASPGRIGQVVSNGLLGLQITAAACLLIISATMLAQANYVNTRPMGYSIKDRYLVSVSCNFPQNATPEQMNQAMEQCTNGTRTLLSKAPQAKPPYFFDGSLLSSTIVTQEIGRTSASEKLGSVMPMTVDTNFLDNMGATLRAGRFFDPNSAYDLAQGEWQKAAMARSFLPRDQQTASAQGASPLPPPPARVPVIVTASVLPMLGKATADEAIGETFVFRMGEMAQVRQASQEQSTYEVVGVVDDWYVRPLKFDVTPIVFTPNISNTAVMEIPKDQLHSMAEAMKAEWRQITNNPNAAVIVVGLEDALQRSYQAEFRLMYALMSFAGVAILVAGLGVYGLSAFEMRRRVREIGIRKAMGATPMKVAGRVIGRALMFAGIAAVIAWPLGWWLANEWLQSFVYRTSLSLAVLPATTAGILAFVAFAVMFNALRAASVRPNIALRT